MSDTRDFGQRIGSVFIPVADKVATVDESNEFAEVQNGTVLQPAATPIPVLRKCVTTLREGCYTVVWQPNPKIVIAPKYKGTLRVENIGGGSIRFSGDLYYFPPVILPALTPAPMTRVARIRLENSEGLGANGATADAPGVIPIYARKSYYSYLKGTTATLRTITSGTAPCWFALNFDEYKYQHPVTGFSGTFPASPTRSIQFRLDKGATPDLYTGKVMQGTTDLGTITVQWVSPFFRRATLTIFRLNGATNPPASVPGLSGGTEDFKSVFATAGWDLSFSFAGDVPLPPTLTGVQDPNQCWSQANCAKLMASLPGYNPADLDTTWRAYLMAIPAKLGCSRGQMFDTGSGNPNNIAREGAVTNSNDGYPASDSAHFGVAQGGMQKDFPRAFLRSASHEVGHTFNQIHQELEGGTDNSIMTTTPSVADVLFTQGKTFPKDINLGFNALVRRHLVHLPDPAVRPGAIDFFGAAVTGPQADEVVWPPDLKLELTIPEPQVALGEPLPVSWTLTNTGESSALVPTRLDIESLTARVSVSTSEGKVTFLRPAEQVACVHNPLRELKPGESVSGSTNVFWGRDGFTFERPGRHTIEVIAMWQVTRVWVASSAQADVWVSFPVSDQDNRVAALLFHPEVGRAIAAPSEEPSELAVQRLMQAAEVHAEHPALNRLKASGMGQRLRLNP